MRRLFTVLFALGAGALMVARQSPEPVLAGVLVGVHRHPDSAGATGAPAPSTLRTAWIEADGRGVAEVGGLLVPRRTGFWWLDLERSCAEEMHTDADDNPLGYDVEIADDLRAWPIDARPTAAPSRGCLARDVYCVTDSRIQIFWVWPDLVSVDRRGEGGCDMSLLGGPSGYTVSRMDDLDSRSTPAAILGAVAGHRLREAFDRAKRDDAIGPHGRECADRATYSPESWHIERQRGGWKIEGWSDTHRLCGYGFDYTIQSDLSRFTRRQPPAPAAWSRIAGATDAISSPDGKWVLVVTDEALLLAPRDALNRPVSRVPLSDHDSVVMAEWATGANVGRWREQVARLAGPPAR